MLVSKLQQERFNKFRKLQHTLWNRKHQILRWILRKQVINLQLKTIKIFKNSLQKKLIIIQQQRQKSEHFTEMNGVWWINVKPIVISKLSNQFDCPAWIPVGWPLLTGVLQQHLHMDAFPFSYEVKPDIKVSISLSRQSRVLQVRGTTKSFTSLCLNAAWQEAN